VFQLSNFYQKHNLNAAFSRTKNDLNLHYTGFITTRMMG